MMHNFVFLYKNQKAMSKYINPFTDFGFKKLFGEEGNKDLLIDFLNEVLGDENHIEDLSFKPTENLPKNELDRKAIFDLYCHNQKGERFIIELQKAKQNFFKDRSVYYSTFPIQEQANKGDWNYQLQAVYTIGILDFKFEDNDKEKVLVKVKLKDQENAVFYDKLTFLYLQLVNFNKTESQLENNFDKWLYVFKNLGTLEAMPERFKNKIFNKLFATAEIAKLNNQEYSDYIDSLKNYNDLRNVLDTARDEGKIEGEEIGFEKGIKEGIREGIREGIEKGIEKALKRGKLTVEEIAEDFEVTVDFVLEIKQRKVF
jgi:predicted transposase/invertase (TIGR01784 family)